MSALTLARRSLLALACAACLPVRAGSYEDFFVAVVRDDPGTINALLQRGFDPNTRDPKGQVGLTLALQNGSFKVFDALLQARGLQVDARNTQDESPLMIAALRGQVQAVRSLIEREADVNKAGWTPLHYAATGGHLKMIELLLEHYAFIDAQAPNGNTPLMMAAYFGTPEAVKLLIEQGADVKMTNQSGKTALDFAQMAKHRNSAELITEALRRSQGVPRGQW